MTKFGDMEFERRIFPRFTIHLPFSYQVRHPLMEEPVLSGEDVLELDNHNHGQMAVQGMTVNASRGGLMIYMQDNIPVGTRLQIKLTLAHRKQVKDVVVEVVVRWIAQADPGSAYRYRAGVQFLDISEENRSIIQWFEQLWLKQNM